MDIQILNLIDQLDKAVKADSSILSIDISQRNVRIHIYKEVTLENADEASLLKSGGIHLSYTDINGFIYVGYTDDYSLAYVENGELKATFTDNNVGDVSNGELYAMPFLATSVQDVLSFGVIVKGV